MAYTTVDNPELYFQSVLWTGDDSTDNAITFDNTDTSMQPNLIWLKPRTKVDNHRWMDSVRGVTKMLPSNSDGVEETISAGLASFDSNGFTLNTTDSGYNSSSYTYVAWNWKAGTSFSNDASSTGIGTIDSTGSASDTAGFSIVSYTGTGSAGTVKHGLSSAPSIVLIKNRSASGKSWIMAHKSIGFGNALFLNLTDGSTSEGSAFNSTAPTSSVFTVGNTSLVNDSGNTYIAYCFSEKKSYSKFGSYTGNGNADGTFVYTGFKPALTIIKNSGGTGPWYLFDNKRPGFNVINVEITANSNDAEATDISLDHLSNGFKLRKTGSGVNGSGNSYIYMAFAEQPFVTSSGVPAAAR